MPSQLFFPHLVPIHLYLCLLTFKFISLLVHSSLAYDPYQQPNIPTHYFLTAQYQMLWVFNEFTIQLHPFIQLHEKTFQKLHITGPRQKNKMHTCLSSPEMETKKKKNKKITLQTFDTCCCSWWCTSSRSGPTAHSTSTSSSYNCFPPWNLTS